MRQHFRAPSFLLAITLVSVTLLAQDFKPATAANAKDFLGKWQASFQGKVFMTLLVSGDAHRLSGTVSSANIEVNKDGELTKAEVGDGADTITSAAVNGKRLRITAKSEDGSEDSMDWEMVLLGPNEAELHITVPPDVPPDVTRPKPWRMTRVPQS